MQRIKLGKPYDEFIQRQIDAGYFGTATEVIRDSLRDKMAASEKNRIDHIRALVEEGEWSAAHEPLIEYTSGTMKNILAKAKKAAAAKTMIPSYLKP